MRLIRLLEFVDYEAILPFPLGTIVLVPIWANRVGNSLASALSLCGIVLLAGQFMILTRTFDRGTGQKLPYFAVNNVVLTLAITAIVAACFRIRA
ncbi:hypothetical protein PLANPX_5448 [Lacipirellula parvula]|uniref:Uncharacterized protein n=1 Tax=Lacipirellula parvula TaxID=2650471 RepID=A0A5K7XM61_9BACT|nr:hypothetical protein PLANPX_5448 [Lacipirellula parvula]